MYSFQATRPPDMNPGEELVFLNEERDSNGELQSVTIEGVRYAVKDRVALVPRDKVENLQLVSIPKDLILKFDLDKSEKMQASSVSNSKLNEATISIRISVKPDLTRVSFGRAKASFIAMLSSLALGEDTSRLIALEKDTDVITAYLTLRKNAATIGELEWAALWSIIDRCQDMLQTGVE
jgi:hypothetical protein